MTPPQKNKGWVFRRAAAITLLITRIAAWCVGGAVMFVIIGTCIWSNVRNTQSIWLYHGNNVYFAKTYTSGVRVSAFINKNEFSSLKLTRKADHEKAADGPPRADFYESPNTRFSRDFLGAGIIAASPRTPLKLPGITGQCWVITITFHYLTVFLADLFFFLILYFRQSVRRFLASIISRRKLRPHHPPAENVSTQSMG